MLIPRGHQSGVWTPTFVPTTGAFGAITYANQIGTWYRIGRMIIVSGFIRTTSITIGTAAGVLTIGGLPFVPVGSGGGAVARCLNWGTAPIGLWATSGGGGALSLIKRSAVNGNTSDSAPADMNTGASANGLDFFCAYFI